MRQTIVALLLGVMYSMLIAGCSSSGISNDFVKEEKLDAYKYDYVADVIVYKEGYSFLWAIPFSSATPEVAKEMIRNKVKEKYPDAAGVYEVQAVNRQGVGLFDWKPSITLWGKVAKAR